MIERVHAAQQELTSGDEQHPAIIQVMGALVALFPISLLGTGLADVFLSIVAVLLLVRSAINRDFSWARQPWVIVALAVWGYLVIRGILSVQPLRSGQSALLWVRFVVFAAALQVLFARSVSLRQLVVMATTVMVLFAAADTIFQYFVGHDIFGRPKFGDRLTGPLHTQAIGYAMLFGGLVGIINLVMRAIDAEQPPAARALAAAGAAVVYVAIALTGERMMLIQAILMLAIVIVVMKLSLRAILAIVAAGLVAVVVTLLAAPDLIQRHTSTVSEIMKSKSSLYVQGMLAGVRTIEHNPVFGVGVENFKKTCGQYVEADISGGCQLIHPHNIWLHIGAEAGLIGVAGFLAIFALALWPALRQWRSWKADPLLMGSTLTVLFHIFPISTSGNFFSNWRSALFWFALGTAAAIARSRAGAEATAPPQSAPHVPSTAPTT